MRLKCAKPLSPALSVPHEGALPRFPWSRLPLTKAGKEANVPLWLRAIQPLFCRARRHCACARPLKPGGTAIAGAIHRGGASHDLEANASVRAVSPRCAFGLRPARTRKRPCGRHGITRKGERVRKPDFRVRWHVAQNWSVGQHGRTRESERVREAELPRTSVSREAGFRVRWREETRRVAVGGIAPHDEVVARRQARRRHAAAWRLFATSASVVARKRKLTERRFRESSGDA